MNIHQSTTADTAITCRVCGNEDLLAVGLVGGHAFFQCSRCEFCFTPLWKPGGRAPAHTLEAVPEGGWAWPGFLEPAFDLLGEDPKRILDLGTGGSAVPDVLRRQGHRVISVDELLPDGRPGRRALEILARAIEDDLFDISYAFDVIEDMLEPVPLIAELLRVTRPGGLVVIHTDPDLSERDADELERPAHCSFYTHRTFEVLLEGTPHEIVWRDDHAVTIAKGLRQPSWHMDLEANQLPI